MPTTMDYLPRIRQLMVAISPQLAAISVGGSITFPTLLLTELQSNTSNIQIDMETSTWIGSMNGFSGLPVILLPILMQWKGRKLAYIIACICVIIGWLLSIIANNTTTFLVSEFFHGISTNSLLPVSSLCLTEMLPPKYRFLAMSVMGISITFGIAVAGILGRFVHFKIVSLVMLVPSTVALFLGLVWPESPSWLAWKGKYHRCKKHFEWLRGSDDESKRELEEVILSETENRKKQKKETVTLLSFWSQVTSRDFYVPSLHILLLLNLLYWSGGDYIIIYFLKLVQKSTQSENATFYGSIVMYVLLFSGSIVTNLSLRRFNYKSVLLTSSFGVTMCLISICVITYLQSIDIISKSSTVCVYFLVAYVAFYGLGLNGIVFYLSAELMPVKHRSLGGALLIFFNCALYASSLKLSPYLVMHFDIWATFLIFSMNAIACSYLVWKYVPETKGRTLVELEEFYKYGYFMKKCHNDLNYMEIVSINEQDTKLDEDI